MQTVDFSAFMTPLVGVVAAVVTALVVRLANRALATIQTATGIQLTEQQRAAMLGAVGTAAGIVETSLDQGLMKIAHVEVANPVIRAQAQAAIAAVPMAAAGLGMTVDGVARMIVGLVDTAGHRPPAPVGLPGVNGEEAAAILARGERVLSPTRPSIVPAAGIADPPAA